MLTSLKIGGYKKFSTLKLNDFSRINFFVGNNNVGKTSLLEAVYIWACGTNIAPLLQGMIAKKREPLTLFSLAEDLMFHVNDRSKSPFKISVEGKIDGETRVFLHELMLHKSILDFHNIAYDKKEHNISDSVNVGEQDRKFIGEWSIKDNKNTQIIHELYLPELRCNPQEYNYPVVFLDILDHRISISNLQIFSHLKRMGQLIELIKEMQTVFPEIEDIDVIPYPDGLLTPLSVKVKGDGYIPLRFFGDGMQRWFNVLGFFVLCKDHIFCIDEIDATLHPAAREVFCKNILQYAKKYNIQLFVTTHSIEFLDAFLRAFDRQNKNELMDDVRIITLRQNEKNNAIKTRTLNGAEALKMRSDFGMELR